VDCYGNVRLLTYVSVLSTIEEGKLNRADELQANLILDFYGAAGSQSAN
jgi:hypothetical protein